MAPVHPLRLSRTYLSLGATCVLAAGAALALAVSDSSDTTYYVVGVLLTVLGTFLALHPHLPLRRGSLETPPPNRTPARAAGPSTQQPDARSAVAGDAPDEAQPRVPLPELLARSDQTELVGRADEAAALLDLVEPREHLVTACLIGEPGIGKTRLAAHVAARAHEAGATVLYGQVHPHAALPYAPLVEALHHYCAHTDAVELEHALGAQLTTLGRLMPGLAPRRAGPWPEQFDTTRYQLSEAIVRLVAYAGRSQPLVLVLDNMQWVDREMLFLLRHVLDRRAELRLTLIVIYRNVDLDANPGLRDVLTDIQRRHQVTIIDVGGLTESETSELVALRTGSDVHPGHARALFQQTSGNPFFIEELARHLADRTSRGAGAVPDLGIRRQYDRRVLASDWELWRQDEQGNEFLVRAFAEREEAEGARDELIARGHRQQYWVRSPAAEQASGENP